MFKKDTMWVVGTGVAIGVLAVALVRLGNPPNMGLVVACFERDIAGAVGLHHAWKAAWIRPEILGILFGSLLAALIFREFRPRGGSSPLARFVLAMFVMIGALAFHGCPVRMTLRLAGGDLNALVGLAGFVGGVAAGVWLLRAGFDLGRASDERTSDGLILPVVFAGLLLCAILLPVFKEGRAIFVGTRGYPGAGPDPVISRSLGIVVSLAAGLAVGFLAQRSRLCFMASVRNLILARNPQFAYGAVAVLLAALIGNAAAGSLNVGFEGQPIAHSQHLWNLLGMALVGLASTLLGGCPLRQLVLGGGGDTDSAITVFGMLAGASVVHNFGFSTKAAPTPYGKAAVVLGLVVVVAMGLSKRET